MTLIFKDNGFAMALPEVLIVYFVQSLCGCRWSRNH